VPVTNTAYSLEHDARAPIPRLARREQVEVVLAATGLVMAYSGSGSSSDRSMPWPAATGSIVPMPVSTA
jgi:hypothetical protein